MGGGDVAEQVRALGWWYQHFELPDGTWTGDGTPPAYYPEERWNAFAGHIPESLAGKSVLDVGGNAGYFAIRMLLRGAKSCTLVDPYREFAAQARFAAAQFGVKLKVVTDDIHTFCLTTEDRFDYVLFLGTFYHLKYPVLVLDRLAEMTKERMVLQSHARTPEEGAGELPTMAFVEGDYRGDHSNWWVPTHEALDAMTRSAGLRVVARPHPEVVVAEPERYLGKVTYRKLVFPRWGKPGHELLPGAQNVDPDLWQELLDR
jgi:tRNA (mo5U34)-methyltransferase